MSDRGVHASCENCDRRFFYQNRTVAEIRADEARSTCAICGEKFQLEQRPLPPMRPDQRVKLTEREIEDSSRLLELALGGSEDASEDNPAAADR